MNKSKIKICGIKNIKTLDCCIKNKVNFFGLIFYSKSPRNINLNKALELISHSNNNEIEPVGVFVNESNEQIIQLIKKLNIKYIQLHGEESNNYISNIKKKLSINIIKNIPIRSKEDFKKISKYPCADFLLFDYKPLKNDLPGGNAKQFSWNLIKNFKVDKPWFLSGGINISNINKIQNYANPYGIDLSSGVEDLPGIKSVKKINSLLKLYDSK